MNDKLITKLQKVLALTTSPNEGEAQAALATLHRLLAQHNLDIADLERRGAHAPSVGEGEHDLGKAAFTWKLDLAEAIAEHFFCVALVDRRTKTVRFVGRPDNVDSMKALYAWLIDQIKRISSARRVDHLAANPGEHVDPLRWQVQFGIGVASRLGDRLKELKQKQQDEAGSALIIHHDTEISDYLEAQYGYRKDGKLTAYDQECRDRWAAQREADAKLAETDIEAFYAKYPWRRPVVETEAEKARRLKREAKASAKYNEQWERKWARDQEKEANKSPEQLRKENQERIARNSGKASAKDINLEPFLTTSDAPHGTTRL